MFADPFSAVMALILLAFVGTLAIFFRIWRELDALRRALGEVRESLQYSVAEVDQQNHELANLAGEIRRLTASQPAAAREPAADNLGTLLEKGLPNLVGNTVFGGKAAYGPEHSSAPAFPDREEEDFFRRLKSGPEEGAI